MVEFLTFFVSMQRRGASLHFRYEQGYACSAKLQNLHEGRDKSPLVNPPNPVARRVLVPPKVAPMTKVNRRTYMERFRQDQKLL